MESTPRYYDFSQRYVLQIYYQVLAMCKTYNWIFIYIYLFIKLIDTYYSRWNQVHRPITF